jgi:ABC-type branched-subunit amino acid transport system ATPase component
MKQLEPFLDTGVLTVTGRSVGQNLAGVTVADEDVIRPPERAARHGLTLVPERRQLYPDLSAADNIVLGCYCWTSSLRKARHSRPFGLALELFPEIGPHLGQPAGTLSGGQQRGHGDHRPGRRCRPLRRDEDEVIG